MNELDKKIEQGNKRLALFNVVWCIIGIPTAFLFEEKDLSYFFIFLFMPYVIIGIFISPYMVNILWKDKT